MLYFVGALCLLLQISPSSLGFWVPQPVQPVAPPKVKAPVPPAHKPDPGQKPVTPETARPPEGAAPPDEPRGSSLIAFPHPLITEVLYSVPVGEKGDANRDGTRHAAGDEFVELVNPHSKPIQLYGYTITDRNPPKKGQLKFTFPAFELPPQGVVVVFNGCEQGWGKNEEGATIVGDQTTPPRGTNPNFHKAYVFSAGIDSSRTSWSNAGDYVLLSDPAGNPIECVHWGEFTEPVPAATLTERAPLSGKASIQRASAKGAFKEHSGLKVPKFVQLQGDSDGKPGSPAAGNGGGSGKIAGDSAVLFSPGWFDVPKPSNPVKPAETPGTKPESPTGEGPRQPPAPNETPVSPKKDKR
ncbi:MAG: lamin tail domain-containing protein [Pyrinomonadaceae bacterium]|nr:lamin tail domain-containing protein [Phycisphaerales bacterium]